MYVINYVTCVIYRVMHVTYYVIVVYVTISVLSAFGITSRYRINDMPLR
jgi:hypothetical protein